MPVPAAIRIIAALCSTALLVAPSSARAQLLAPAVRHHAVADLRIPGDSDDPRAALSHVEGAVMLPDGSLVVAQPQEYLLRQFDARGRFVRQIGTKGKGPGEFERVTELGRLADTVYVIDTRNARVQLFPSPGTPPTSLRLPLLTPPGGQRAELRALLAGGAALSMTREGEGEDQVTNVVWLHRRDSGAAVPVFRAREAEFMARVAVGPARLGFRQPFASPSFLLSSPPSGTVAAVEQLPATDRRGTGTLRLTWHREGRQEVQTFAYRMPELRRSYADSLVRRVSAELAADMRSSGGTRVTAAALERDINRVLHRPVNHPLTYQIRMDDDGRVWLRSRGSADWYVIAAGATRPLVVALPAKAELLVARGQVVWMLERDEYDVPSLVRYRVAPR